MRTAFVSAVFVRSPVSPLLAAEDAPPKLFPSDMSLMAGMTAEDPMAGMAMPRWSFMDIGVFRFGYDRQGGPSGDTAVESSNWNMAMAQRDLAGGRLTLMLMNSLEPATMPEAGSPHLFQTGESRARTGGRAGSRGRAPRAPS